MKRTITATMVMAVAGLIATGQESAVPSAPHTSPDIGIMLAAVSRDTSVLSGGVSSSKWTGRGTAVVEPLALLTASGEWINIPCSSGDGKDCRKFQREYLNYPHEYRVISADGKGAVVQAKPTSLDECFDYSGTGTYSGASIAKSAIATNSPDLFVDSAPLRLLSGKEIVTVQRSLATLVPKKLDSTKLLRIFSLRLEGQEVFVVQRSFSDVADPIRENQRLIFIIGVVENSHFRILYWKQNTEDENERVLGTIRLKSGREFLVTVVNEPESHIFHVYGIRDGHLRLIFAGGGSSC